MLMKFLFTLLLLGWLLPMARPARAQAAESAVRFQIKNAGLTVDGSFSGLTASVSFDAAHPEQARIEGSVPVSSISTGIGLRDKHLQKPDYFDAVKYPTIALQAKRVRATGRGQYEGMFALTMKGVTREVKMPFTVSATREFRGQLTLNRLDFGIGKKSFLLADNVLISIRFRPAASQ